VNADLALIHCLPKFTHWVLDVSFFKVTHFSFLLF
jgi:hypothetical protein